MKRSASLFSLLVLLLLFSSSTADARPLRPDDISVPDGFTIEVAADGLAAPTMVTWDDQGRMLVAESGYDQGGEPKVTRIESKGAKVVLTKPGVFGSEKPVTSIAFYQGQIYVVHAGTVSIIQPDGTLKDIITGLPGQGDHQANTILFKDGQLYLSIGTVTNSAVAGPDNAVFGWLKDPKLRQLHDVPCQDIQLAANATFESANPLEQPPNPVNPQGGGSKVRTSAYAPFGTVLPDGNTVKGNVKCNGAILRANPDGSNLQVYAWGFRNPYGLAFGPDGALYATMHGFDARGSRPVENAWDCFYKVKEGAWYGWPDFACDVPVTDSRFKTKDQPQPQFILANHPTETPPKPLVKFGPHDANNGFTFVPASLSGWGKPTDAYVALFGDFTPATGTVDRPVGVKVVKVDTTTGQVTEFLVNKTPGQASRHTAGGLEHPSAVAFGPDGEMYVTDWGVANVSVDGLKLEKDSGVVWRVSRGNRAGLPGGPTLIGAIIGTLLLGLATVVTARAATGVIGPALLRRPFDGLWTGAIAGLVFGVFAMLVSALALQLPWYAPPRVMAIMVMGGAAIANILQFDPVSFTVGLVVVLVLCAVLGTIFIEMLRTRSSWRTIIAGLLFGLTVWALLQYFVLPLIWPLITEKGFPPLWYALSFAVYGLALGALLSWVRLHRDRRAVPVSSTEE